MTEAKRQETKQILNDLASFIDGFLNESRKDRKWGFALLMYPFDAPPHGNRMNYIGNGKREDVLVAIKELAAHWEGRYHEGGKQ